MKFPHKFSANRTKNLEKINKQRGKYPDIVKKMIKICDVILEVLDARFIEETRNEKVEKQIKKQGKKLVYVLNKADLVDKRKIKLNKEITPAVFVSCKFRKGSGLLRDAIRDAVESRNTNYARAHVGIIGYPNTGKSSLINFLTGKKSARTAHEAGFTKGVQKIRLSKNILLLDTPGVISEEHYSMSDSEKIIKQVKIGARNSEDVKEPEMILDKLMKEYSKQMEKFYGICADGDTEVLIEKLGRQKKFLAKGGIVDVDKTARLVLRDWQRGRIRV